MNPHAELHEILGEIFDSQPNEARRQKLRDLLHAHPELQSEYVELVELHALLQFRSGQAAPPGSRKSDSEKAIPSQMAPVTQISRGWTSRRGLAAGLIFMAASIAILFFFLLPEAQAGPDPLVPLINWNLEIAQSPLVERQRIYSTQLDEHQKTLAKVVLSTEDRNLADTVLDFNAWLTKNDDALAKAQLFNELADRLVDRLDSITVKQSEKRVENFVDAYRRLAEQGVDANLELAAAGPLDLDKTNRLQQVLVREDTRSKKLQQIIERHPERRKAIHKGMKGHFSRKGKKLQRPSEE